MAWRTITARFDGTCRKCGGRIYAGEPIRYGGRGMVEHTAGRCASGGEADPRSDGGYASERTGEFSGMEADLDNCP